MPFKSTVNPQAIEKVEILHSAVLEAFVCSMQSSMTQNKVMAHRRFTSKFDTCACTRVKTALQYVSLWAAKHVSVRLGKCIVHAECIQMQHSVQILCIRVARVLAASLVKHV